MSIEPPRWLQRVALPAVVVIFLLVYATSFSSFPVLEARHSVLGDADAAAFVPLIREFDLATPIGDEYRTPNRTLRDVAQKHKIHHLLYAAVAHGIYRVISLPLGALGVSERAILYSVNAVIGAACLILLWALLGTANPNGNPRLPFLIFGGASFSIWLYSSMPESWPLSAFLVLLTLLILAKDWLPWWGVAIWIGIAMLNNITLAMLLVPLGMRIVTKDPALLRVLGRSAVASVLAFGVWLGALSFLSIWEPDLRPDHFFQYLFWFRQFVGEPLPPLDPYNWKVVISNFFFTALVSNQSDPYVPADALRRTFQESVLGAVASVVVFALLALIAWRLVRLLRGLRLTGLAELIRREPVLMAAVYLAVDFVVILLMYPDAAILYSSAVVMLYAYLACRFLDLRRRGELAFFVATLFLLVINNAAQVLWFRETLAGITS